MMKFDYVTTTYVVNQTIKKQRELEFPLDWIMKKHGNFSCLVAPTASRALYHPLNMCSKDHLLITQECFGKNVNWSFVQCKQDIFLNHPVAGYNLSRIGAQFMRISNI